MRVDSRCGLVAIPSSQGDPAEVSLRVLENRPDLGRTDRLVRTIQCSRRATYPGRRFALPWAISFCPFGADGSGAGQRPEARGQREQPNSRKTLVRSSAGIQGSRKTRGLSPGISYTIWGSFRPCQRDVGRVELHKTAFLRHKPFCVSQMQRKSSSPLGKTNRFSHYGKNASFLKGSQYPQRTGARD